MALCYVNCWLKKVFLHNKYIKTQWLVQKIFLKFDAFIVYFKKKKLPRPGIIQSSTKLFGIEPGTFRSSVWRSPNWAISASDEQVMILAIKFIYLDETSNLKSSFLISQHFTPCRSISSISVLKGKVQLTNDITILTLLKEEKGEK